MDAGRAHATTVARPALWLAALLLAPQVGAQAPTHSSWDAALRWEGDRHGTLGPTGRRLFAARLEPAPGCQGRFHYGAGSVGLADPIRLELLREGEPIELEPAGTTWYPSRVEARWRSGDLRLDETKLVTDGDALVDELSLSNLGSRPLALELHVSGGATPQRERGSSRMLPVDLSGAATFAPVGGTPLFTDLPAPEAVWVEAEAFESSAAAAAEASAGSYVPGFGEGEGQRHLLVATAPPLERPSLLLRYANPGEATARLAVEIDGDVVGELELPPTGGWRFARTSLSELPAGRVLIGLVAATTSPVDLDGVFLAEQGLVADPLPEGGSYDARVPEQLELHGGARELDGVRYSLPTGAEVRRPSLVALRGGIEGDRARDLPERVGLALPDASPARATLHLLLRSETPRGRGAESSRPASITFLLDDGSAETVAWPAGAGGVLAGDDALRARTECVAVAVGGLDGPTLQLSYDPPPGRAVKRLEFAAGDGPEVPVLLAATVEALAQTGRLPVLVGEAALEGQPVELVLAATDAVAAHDPDGKRSLAAYVSLAPGETRRLRVVLATGSRRPQTLLQALESIADEELVERHRATFEAWFSENVPGFTCSDPWLERAWRQRWTLVRRNLLRLDLPDFSLAVAYEGTCCAEHARVSPRAASFALRELRWLRDPTPAQGTVRALLKRQRPDGLLFPVAPDLPPGGGSYVAHDLAASAIGVWEVTGSRQYLEEVLELLERELEAALLLFDSDGDERPGPFSVVDGTVTGMPGRPSFQLAGRGAPVEPVELGVLLGSTARALARGHAALGNDVQALRLEHLGAQLALRTELLSWDEASGWYLSLDADRQPVRPREIAGILPLATGSPWHDGPAALETLFSPDAFWARHGVRSVALSDALEHGERSPLAWNGPVHPEALTWAVDAVAHAARQRRDAGTRERLRQVLDVATRIAFEHGDLERPVAREAWDPDMGRGVGCVDLLRSTYADLLVRHVAGVVPRADGLLELDPLVGHLEHFRFTGLPHRGRLVDVTWDRPDGVRHYEAQGLGEGFTVVVDGAPHHHGSELGRVIFE